MDIRIPSVEDAYKLLNLLPNPDGSFTRTIPTHDSIPWAKLPTIPPHDFSRDVPLNPHHKTFIRLFRPRNIPPETKLPLVFYFHGGGFVLLSAATSAYHDFCSQMADHLPAVIASVEYRLAPEHRLPAAYDDAVEAILWAKNQGSGDPWIGELVDLSKVFLMGSSAGGNIVYHTALRAVDLDLRPLKIVGLIMNQPFFAGVQRSDSEVRLASNPIIPLHATDLMWSLCLPDGADRGHEFSDPSSVGPHVEKIGKLPASVVRTYAGDILVDRQKELAKVLELHGVDVVPQFIDGGYHAVELFDPEFEVVLLDDFRDFVSSIAG